MAGSMGKRDWVTVMGGGVVFSALIFGGGLLMLGSSSGGHEQANADAGHGDDHGHGKDEKAKEDHGHGHGKEETDKKDGHAHDEGYSGHGGHGEKKQPAAEELYEEPFITETTELGGGSKKKDEDGHGDAHGHGATEAPAQVVPVADRGPLRDSHMADGDAALARGQADDAYLKYRKAYQDRDPRVPVAKILLRMAQASLQSETLGLQSRSTRALRYYSQILNDHPYSPYADDALYESGYTYLRGGAPEKAEEAFEHYLKSFPEGEHRIDVQLGLIDLKLAEDRPDKALALLKTLKSDQALREEDASRVLLREAETNLKLSRLTHSRRRVLRAEKGEAQDVEENDPSPTPPPPPAPSQEKKAAAHAHAEKESH